MKAIGIDIGTTTICGVLTDEETGELLASQTECNTSECDGSKPYERCQEPEKILAICRKLVEDYEREYGDICCIGITGQMHGILYLDQNGTPVSYLYTWQDGSGNEPCQGLHTYSSFLSEKTGYPMASGFGLTTLFAHQQQGKIPEHAAVICTIPDYVAMTLAGRKRPLLHPSMAASLGCFDVRRMEFDRDAIRDAGIAETYLPEVTREDIILGKTKQGIPVSVAFGDNQASFLGSVKDGSNILVNVGTGSQISVCCDHVAFGENVEYRPYLKGKYLMTGSSLCGGYAYALLKKFFEEICSMAGMEATDGFYEKMNAAGRIAYERQKKGGKRLFVDTRFNGTRKEPFLTGEILGLQAENFHPGDFIAGTLQGICQELYGFYEELPEAFRRGEWLTGSGNGIRKNPLLQEMFCDTFHMKLTIPPYAEEAAYGSSLFAVYASSLPGMYAAGYRNQKR